MIYNLLKKSLGVPYTIYLKIRYFRKLEIRGFIFPEGMVSIAISRNAKLVINGNITLRKGTQLLIRENAQCIIEKKVFFNRNCSLVCRKSISIGNNTLIGESVKIYDHDHYFDRDSVYPDKFNTESIVIGSNVWIANDVNILKGSVIPDQSIIAAMSLVNKPLMKSAIYAGIPVKLLKERSD